MKKMAWVLLFCWGLLCIYGRVLAAPQLAAEGLPENCPDLYDPAIVASYRLVRQQPYRDGRLRSTILADDWAYFQREGSAERKPLVFLIGYLTDAKNGRIVAIVETFLHNDASGRRSVRAWMDRGWLRSGNATGDWDSPTNGRISAPLTAKEAARLLASIYKGIDAVLSRFGPPEK